MKAARYSAESDGKHDRPEIIFRTKGLNANHLQHRPGTVVNSFLHGPPAGVKIIRHQTGHEKFTRIHAD